MKVTCSFCGADTPPEAGVRGRNAVLCRACLGRAVLAAIDERARPGAEVPEADVPCSFCDRKTPPSALFREGGGGICTGCVSRAFDFATGTMGLETRRQTWQHLDEVSPAGLVRDHFAAVVPAEQVVTASRTFPAHLRVDLDQALVDALASGRCVGVHQQYAHETLSFATLLKGQHHGHVFVAPLQRDEVDVGADEPARCLATALWLVDAPLRHVVLLSQHKNYGESSGWRVEVAVPPGEAGEPVVRALFARLEQAIQRSAAYRGKVLSLEKHPHMRGTASAVTVHRLAPVGRDDVILPSATLELLERNVFSFARHREALRAMGLPVKKGLLFYGPPGTGKTHTVRYLAGALPGHTTLLVTAEQMGLLAEYMTLARLLSPSIVVIEDVDLIARQREDIDSTCEEVLLNQLLNEMDGLRENTEVLFVLTTNRPQALELALTSRPGRIDQAIEFPLPDAAGREKLARLYGRGATVPADTLAHVVERTAGVSAAFIRELMRRSAQFALEHGAGGIRVAEIDEALNEMSFVGGRLNAALLGAAARSSPGT